MKRDDSGFELSAGDLSAHLGCRHLTQLERQAAEGQISPPDWHDPMLAVLKERGLVHERGFLDYLRTERGLAVVEIEDVGITAESFERTVAAMREGAPAIAQAVLIDGRWRGRADLLLRVEQPSDLGPWSYEVVDTKLAAETRGGTILQICLYSELVARVQGRLPEYMHVVTPGRYATPERYRTADFTAYCRQIRRRLESELDEGPGSSTYPEPVPHCDICRWWPECDRRRRQDDHLSLVAGVGRLHRGELEALDIDTVGKLARISLPLEPRPARGSAETYEKAHHQARVQVASRGRREPVFELLPAVEPGRGLARLPEPSPGDVFLDLEGDPFVEGGGREYLIGWVSTDPGGNPEYRALWALDAEAERRAFEALIDALMARWEAHPGFHIYHFAPYEPAALKRLMGRYATREEELDRLLRAERFIDLHGVVRQGLRVGIERYSLKDLEILHAFTRALDLREASAHLRRVERALELGDVASISAESRGAVEQYNREDCLSAWSLRRWLEQVREDAVDRGAAIPRPELGEGEPPAKLDERQQRLLVLFERLNAGVPAERAERSDEQQARWLLGHLLEWHRREDKATWWGYFRLRDLTEEQLLEERAGIAGLSLEGCVGGTAKCPIHRYRFPAQDHDVRAGKALHAVGGAKIGEVAAIDPGSGWIDIKKRADSRDTHPTAVFVHDYVDPEPMPGAIERLANWVIEHDIDADGANRAARDMLLRRPPRLAGPAGGVLVKDGEDLLEAAKLLALELDGGVLPVQGPPGAGKTFMGARMICALVRQGKKVGITAVSHKVIRNLLDETLEAAASEGLALQALHKVSELSATVPARLSETKENKKLLEATESKAAQVIGATPWAWARPDFQGAVDILVVDEAGQMSLANAVAAAGCATSVILLGDPQQLEQPIQGCHPEGTDVSVLQHLLGAHETLPSDRGLFLAETWRLHPEICAFTSEVFYLGGHPKAAIDGHLKSGQRGGCPGR